jgi:hypothetical protein
MAAGIKRMRYEYLLMLIGALWTLAFSFLIQLTPHLSPVGDDGSYVAAARLLYLDGQIDNTRPMLTSAIYGLPFLLGLADNAVINWGLTLNFIAWFASILLIFKTLELSTTRRIAFIGSASCIFFIGHLAHAFNLLTECIFIAGILASVYCVARYYKTLRAENLSIAISILLFNSLIKPVALGLAIIIIIFFFRCLKEIALNRYSILVLTAVGLIHYQSMSVKRLYGDYTISYIGDITYYNYIGSKADAYRRGVEFEPGTDERYFSMIKLSSHQVKQLAKNDMREQLSHNTLNLIRAYGFCIYSNSSKGNFIVSMTTNDAGTWYFDAAKFTFKAISKLQNIIFTMVSVAISFYFLVKPRRHPPFYRLLSVMTLLIFFISGMSCFQCDRFHIAFFPLMIIMLSHLVEHRRLHWATT